MFGRVVHSLKEISGDLAQKSSDVASHKVSLFFVGLAVGSALTYQWGQQAFDYVNSYREVEKKE